MQHHAESGHYAREKADSECDGIHHAVNERVEPDPEHGNKADGIVRSGWFVANLCCEKPI